MQLKKFFSKSPAQDETDDDLISDSETMINRGPVELSAATEIISSGKRVLSPEENLARVTKLRKALIVTKK